MDSTTVQAVLSGFVVAVLAQLAWYAFSRLWQKSIASDAAGAIDAAVEMGLQVEASGLRPWITAVGTIDDERVVVRWMGGVRGERCAIRHGRRRRVVPMLRTSAQLLAVFAAEE